MIRFVRGVGKDTWRRCREPTVTSVLAIFQGCLLCETGRPAKTQIWKSRCVPIIKGACGCSQKHGVGILLNWRWRRKLIKANDCHGTEASAKTGFADIHVEQMYPCIESHCNCSKNTTVVARDFGAQLGPGEGSECNHVEQYTLDDSNTRGYWLKHWLMI